VDGHPSLLTLDRLALGAPAPHLTEHLAVCLQCQTHLKALAERLPPLPPQFAALPPRRARWRLPSFSLGAAALAAAAVLVALAIGLQPRPPASRLTVKGTPSVAVYLKRAGRVALWDGHSPIQPGDRLRLEVAPEGYRYLAVASPAGGNQLGEPLFQGAIDPARAETLPDSWLVDDAPGAEALVIALSQSPLATEVLADAAAHARRDPEVWTTTLLLPKSTPTPPSENR
jgi:hypothetical protein